MGFPDAAILFVGSQITWMLRFFLSKNLRISRERAWTQTVISRGKGPEFWQSYVEEWETPPKIEKSNMPKFLSSPLGLSVVRSELLAGACAVLLISILKQCYYYHLIYIRLSVSLLFRGLKH